MRPYAELLEFNQPNPIRIPGFTKIRDAFPGLSAGLSGTKGPGSNVDYGSYFHPESIMEFAGRGDYGEKNQRRLGETTKVKRYAVLTQNEAGEPEGHKNVTVSYEKEVPILQKYIDMGHQSMIEFGWATFYMEFSRVVLAELTRHRLASYQVESQRFVKYGQEGENIADFFFFPDVSEDDKIILAQEYESSYQAYIRMRERGVAPQDARYVLPNAFKTRMCMAANIREWRHILQLRLDKSAQPEMRELMQQVYDQLVMVFPNALYGVLDNGRGIR